MNSTSTGCLPFKLYITSECVKLMEAFVGDYCWRLSFNVSLETMNKSDIGFHLMGYNKVSFFYCAACC